MFSWVYYRLTLIVYFHFFLISFDLSLEFSNQTANSSIINLSRIGLLDQQSNERKEENRIKANYDLNKLNDLKFDSNYFASLNAANHHPLVSTNSGLYFDQASANVSFNDTRKFFFPSNNLNRLSLKGSSPANFAFGVNHPMRPFSMSSFQTSEMPIFENYIDPRFRLTMPFSENLQMNSALDPIINNETENALKKKPSAINRDKVDYQNEPNEDGYMYDMMNENLDKYYIQDPFLLRSKLRTRTPSKSDKPFRQQDFITPENELNQEDYDSNDFNAELKSLPPILKSTSHFAKFTGPAPYRLPHYTSYYPVQYFSTPYERPMPSKSSSSINSWSGLAGFLLGILPLGILMASMVPAFVSVPVTTAAAGIGKRKKRASNDKSNINQILFKYNWAEFMKPQCLSEICCQIISSSSQDLAIDFLETVLLNKIEHIVDKHGLEVLVKAAKSNRCTQVYKCHSK